MQISSPVRISGMISFFRSVVLVAVVDVYFENLLKQCTVR